MTMVPGLTADGARAHGSPIVDALIRCHPEDFDVTELLGFEPSGGGEHDFLFIEKTGQNTAWVAAQLARHAGVAARDVGFAGLKDRHGVTRQWFSVRRAGAHGTDWDRLEIAGVRLLEITRNSRKLRRGAHRGNRFRIALRSDAIDSQRDALEARLAAVADGGVPNFFGAQRFGRRGRNIELAGRLFAGARLSRGERGHALSAARSLLFNAVLSRRVGDQTWNVLRAGDRAMLDGSHSTFAVDVPTPELAARCRALDVHPTATLWGRGAPLGTAAVGRLEREVAKDYPVLSEGLVAAAVAASSRALRVRVTEPRVEFGNAVAWFSFTLPSGAYATVLLQEFADCRDQRSLSST